MLIIALVLALIGLVALVFAVVTSNEVVAWVCIGASVLGVVLLIIDALRERQRRDGGGEEEAEEAAPANEQVAWVDYPEDDSQGVPEERHPGADTEAGEHPAVSADGRSDERGT